MVEKTVPTNIKRYREAKGFSIEQIVAKSGLPIENYIDLETGQTEITFSDLDLISSVLEVPFPKLVSPVRDLRNVRFRSNRKLANRKVILLDVGHWLNDFEFVEDILDEHLPNYLEEIGKHLKGKKNRVELAVKLTREAFGLSADEPVLNICRFLESSGIKVGEQNIQSHDFFGLSIGKEDGGPAIIVNTWDGISVERWIFTAAHELGHLVLHQSDFKVGQTKEEKKHEEEANAFASQFLMPVNAFQKEWNGTYGRALVDRVLEVKRIFRVSYRTVLYHLASNSSGSENIWARFQRDFKSQYGKTLLRSDEPEALKKDAFRASFPEYKMANEPDKLSPKDFVQNRLFSLVRKALEQERMSLGRGAEILEISLQEMRDLTTYWVS